MASITTITAFVRAGATDHAWRLFRAAGLEMVLDNPDVLILHGRLLKEQSRAANSATRRRILALDAGKAYADAAALRPATYPLVNAATLALLGGDPALARQRAHAVLDLLEHGTEPDTPYWQMATKAEALLLMGEVEQAHVALDEGMALAPRAWEDHAVTLRQFREVITMQGGDPSWLDGLRPPRSLHFTGVMQLGADISELADAIDECIATEQIGFGFGALAAGADILVAQRLLAAGAELHLVLPGGLDAFRARSVVPYGALDAFEAILAQATSVRSVGNGAVGFDAAIQMADEMAMGLAVMQAEALQSDVLQLVVRPDPATVRTSSAAQTWSAAGRRQHVLACVEPFPGRAPASSVSLSASSPATSAEATAVRNMAFLHVSLAWGEGWLDGAMGIAARLVSLPDTGALRCDPAADGLRLAYATSGEAVAGAMTLRDNLVGTGTYRIAGHYGPVATALDHEDKVLAFGPDAALASQLVPVTPETAIVMSEELACAWRATDSAATGGCEFIGEVQVMDATEPVRLHALKRSRPNGQI